MSNTQTYILSEFFHNCLADLNCALGGNASDKANTFLKNMLSGKIATRWEEPTTNEQGAKILSIPSSTETAAAGSRSPGLRLLLSHRRLHLQH